MIEGMLYSGWLKRKTVKEMKAQATYSMSLCYHINPIILTFQRYIYRIFYYSLKKFIVSPIKKSPGKPPPG
jgi:hypothetical protein